jgi:hypothetical protein
MAPLHNPLVAEFRFPAPIPPLPVGTSGPDVLARARVRREMPGGIELDGVTVSGLNARVRLTFVGPGVARVELEPPTVGRT